MGQIVAKILSNMGVILRIQNELKMVPTYLFIGGSVENIWSVLRGVYTKNIVEAILEWRNHRNRLYWAGYYNDT